MLVALGPALGGCRVWPYEKPADDMTETVACPDARRLARQQDDQEEVQDLIIKRITYQHKILVELKS